LDGEDVERLARDHGADDERDRDGDTEVHRDASMLQIVDDGAPAELAWGFGAEASRRGDPAAGFGVAHAGRGLREHERHQVALAADVGDRLAIASIEDWEVSEGRGRIADTDDLHAMVVHLERAAEGRRLAGEKELVASAINNDGVGLAER